MRASTLDACSSSVCLEVGAHLWVPCEKQVWRGGVVVGGDAGHVVVKVHNDTCHENVVIDTKAAGPRGGPAYMLRSGEFYNIESVKAVEDLSLLPMLGEPEALYSLRMRYFSQHIYTFAGPVLLAVNPHRNIPGLYDNEQLHNFACLPHGCPPPSPHIFSIARDAYLGVQIGNMSQTVLVSGESGAGKTETAKLVIRFLVLAGGQTPGTGEVTMEHRVLASVPLLEALGNARTLKNDNSSRFGKFVELRLKYATGDFRPCILDSQTHTYLLETVRVTALNEGERCFHIFYQILAAAARARTMTDKIAPGSWDVLPSALRRSSQKVSNENAQAQPLLLTLALPSLVLPDYLGWSPEQFDFLARSNYTVLPGVDEAVHFDRTVEAMRALQICEHEIAQVISALVAVLFLGNVRFQNISGNSEAAEINDVDGPTSPLKVASAFLGVEKESLATALCTRELQVHGKSTKQLIRKCRTPSQALDCRDALARHLYGMVFAFIVSRINEALSTIKASGHDSIDERNELPTIGVLDIFGFEVFERNCFEQLCINFSNEVLQQHFTMVVFAHELALYEAEGIQYDLDEVKAQAAIAQQRVSDSGALLSSAFSLLDEECSVSGGTSDSWLHKLTMSTSDARNTAFRVVHHRKGHFVIHHFAGPVEYCADAFLTKNKDTLSAEALACMQGSSSTVLQQQFNKHERKSGTIESPQSGRVLRAKRHTVSANFRGDLTSLMAKIQSTCSRFVRCIKPNQIGASHWFDGFSVAEQLRFQGVLEAIRVARVGYAVKWSHKQAVMIYWVLAPSGLRRQLEKQVRRGMNFEAAQILFPHLGALFPEIPARGIQVGKTMTFFKQDAIEVLGTRVFVYREGGALRVQTAWRTKRLARRFSAIRNAVLKLQTHSRAHAARKLAATKRKCAAISLQAAERRRQARRAYQKIRCAVMLVQAWWRGKHQHALRCEQRLRAIVRLQRWCRKCLETTRTCETLATQPVQAALRLQRIRTMVEQTLIRIDTLDAASVDVNAALVSKAMKSLERTSCRLSRKAEVLSAEPTSQLDYDIQRSPTMELPMIAAWTPKNNEMPREAPQMSMVPTTPRASVKATPKPTPEAAGIRQSDHTNEFDMAVVDEHVPIDMPQGRVMSRRLWSDPVCRARSSHSPPNPRSETSARRNSWFFVPSWWPWQCAFCACEPCEQTYKREGDDSTELRHANASGSLFSVFPDEGSIDYLDASPVLPSRGVVRYGDAF